MAARGFLGAGDLYVRRINPLTGALMSMYGPYEVEKFEYKPNVESKEKMSKGRITYGQVIESVNLPKPAEFAVTFGEVDREGLTLALMGSQSVINTPSGTIAEGAALSVVVDLGGWVELPHQNWETVVVKDATGATTYVEGTHYLVNYRLGWLKVISGIADAATVKVHGAYNAISGTRISASTVNEIRAQFVLDGINFADKLPCIATVWEGIVAPDTAFDFLADDFNSIPLTGRAKTPVGKTEPFFVELRDAA
ncbi:MAG: hypothetical protein JNK52_12140 [Zoogloeaceae bacterium]|nr:hypothetical protein [Zoogloeaceae bacterium]